MLLLWIGCWGGWAWCGLLGGRLRVRVGVGVLIGVGIVDFGGGVESAAAVGDVAALYLVGLVGTADVVERLEVACMNRRSAASLSIKVT